MEKSESIFIIKLVKSMIKNLLYLALVSAMLLTLVQTETVFEGTIGAWCPANGDPSFTASDQTTANTVSFDFTSTIYTDEKQSTLLFVKQGSGATGYSFKSYSNAGVVVGSTTCTGSGAYFFHALLNEFLFLTNNGGKYYVCKYDKSADSVPIELSTTGLFSPLNDWDPFMVSGNTIFVLASSSSNSKVVSYTWATPGTPVNPISPVTTRPQTPVALATPYGSEQFLYDKNRTRFIRVDTAGTGWEADTVLTSTVLGSNKVDIYPLRETRAVITLTSIDAKSGAVYTAYQKAATQQLAYVAGSTTNIQDFTDNQHNFLRLHSDTIFWLTMRTTTNSFAFIKSTIQITELDLANRGLALAKIFNIGLSQNKASILYDTGSLDIFRHEDSGVVKLLFSKTIAGSPVISTGQSKQYKVVLDCVCSAIKKFVCFSQTLNCVIVNKAGASCANVGDTYLQW